PNEPRTWNTEACAAAGTPRSAQVSAAARSAARRRADLSRAKGPIRAGEAPALANNGAGRGLRCYRCRSALVRVPPFSEGTNPFETPVEAMVTLGSPDGSIRTFTSA